MSPWARKAAATWPATWCTGTSGLPCTSAIALRRLHADEQRADEPRPLRHRDRREVGEARLRFRHRRLDDRHDRLEVVARGELRHDAAVGGVDRGLARDDVREDAPAVLDDRGRGLVAGGLDAEDAQAGRRTRGYFRPRPGRRSSRASSAPEVEPPVGERRGRRHLVGEVRDRERAPAPRPPAGRSRSRCGSRSRPCRPPPRATRSTESTASRRRPCFSTAPVAGSRVVSTPPSLIM